MSKKPVFEKKRAKSPLSNRQIHVNSHRVKKNEQKVQFSEKDEQKVHFGEKKMSKKSIFKQK